MAARLRLLIACVALILANRAAAAPTTPSPAGAWVNISEPLVQQLKSEGKKIGYPGETAGIAADPVSGALYLIIPDQGVWSSTDQGKTFARIDGGNVGGRCETSFTLNVDPAGGRLACFMLDGKCAQSPDAGKTWLPFAPMGRNWDYAAVDWPATAGEPAANILAAHHESGGKVYLSVDSGKTWKHVFTDPEFEKTGGLGVFDDKTLVHACKGKGIQRSTDRGESWQKVSEMEPAGRVVRVSKGVAYWLDRGGILTSHDKGATWSRQGAAVDATVGPYFDPKDAKHIVAAGAKGIFETTDAGETWNLAAPLPPGFDLTRPGWFINIAWCPEQHTFFASRMGKPAFRWEPARP